MDAAFAYLNCHNSNLKLFSNNFILHKSNLNLRNSYLTLGKNNLRARKKFANRQTGTILIMVLLIAALVAGLAIKFAGEYQLGLARAESRWFGAQIRAYFLSGEAVVGNMLKADLPDRDDRTEAWAQSGGQEYPVDGGSIQIQISDASAQIDLNSLLINKLDPNKPLTDPQKYDQAQRMFIRLLQEFPEYVRSVDEAAAILQSVVYWAEIVEENTVNDDDQYYATMDVPYRASHSGAYRSLEELQLVRGITPELMKRLRPLLVVFGGNLKMNINTLPRELIGAINLKSDLRPMDITAGDSLYQELGEQPIKQIAQLDTLMKSHFGQTTEVDRDFDNKTQYFWLKMVLTMGDQVRSQRSLMLRGNNGTPFVPIRREEVF